MATNPSLHLQFVANASYLLRQTAPETSAHLMSRYIDLATKQTAQPSSSILTDVHRQRICTGCGNIMIPGCDNTKISIRTAKQPQPHSGKGGKQRILQQGTKGETAGPDVKRRLARLNPNAGIRKIYSCGLCGKDTRIDLPPPVPLPKHRRRAALAGREGDHKTVAVSAARADIVSSTTKPLQKSSMSVKATVALAASSTTTGANAASNASSKKRAKSRKAGLLALLDKNRESASSGGLDNLSLSFDDFRKK